MVLLWLVFIVVASVAGLFCIALAFYLMAKLGVVFTFVNEGEIKVVMAGESLVRFLPNIQGWKLLEGKMKPIPLGEKDGNRTWLNRRFGLYFIGWPPFRQLLRYRFLWHKWVRSTDGTFAMIQRDEMVDSVFFRYPYPVLVTNVLLQGNVKVSITLIVTVQIVAPETTLFKIKPSGDWLNLLSAKIEEAVRDWAGKRSLDTLRELQESEKSRVDFRNEIEHLNTEPVNKTVVDLLGVEIISTEFQYFTFAGDLEAAFQQKVLAEQVAAARIAEADGEGQYIERLATATAAKIGQEGRAKVDVLKKIKNLGLPPEATEMAVATLTTDPTAQLPRGLTHLTNLGGGQNQTGVTPVLNIEPAERPPTPAKTPETKSGT